MVKLAFEKFDLALEKFAETSADGDHGCSITKRHILTLYSKILLAEQLGEYEASDKAREQIEPLIEKARECDPDFSRTLVAKLIEGRTDYIPQLPVDNTEYYESIRQKIVANRWQKLPEDQREPHVNNQLAELAALETEETFDRETYERILGPEKKGLIAAKEGGFVVEEAAGSSDDPNDF